MEAAVMEAAAMVHVRAAHVMEVAATVRVRAAHAMAHHVKVANLACSLGFALASRHARIQ